jgi:hypothetical protein
MTYNLVFRVRREYFDAILQGVKDREVRRYSPFWETRVAHASAARAKGQTIVGVFICGKDEHRRHVTNIYMELNAKAALGREPSAQGAEDLGDGTVFVFKLGNAL